MVNILNLTSTAARVLSVRLPERICSSDTVYPVCAYVVNTLCSCTGVTGVYTGTRGRIYLSRFKIVSLSHQRN